MYFSRDNPQSPTQDFYVKKIAEGVATLAASVYPKRIIVRLSDFKSNEQPGTGNSGWEDAINGANMGKLWLIVID